MTDYQLKFDTSSFCLASLGDGVRSMQVCISTTTTYIMYDESIEGGVV